GGDLRGNAVATYVVASASDGYQVVFSLAELDPAFTGSEIIVADTIDGKSLFAYQGPFRIVAPKDTRAARSIRMLERLDVVPVKHRCLLGLISLLLALIVSERVPADSEYVWTLPSGFPAPPVPSDNPMSVAKAELGRHLFYDKRLSGNQTQSCATCHEQSRAF